MKKITSNLFYGGIVFLATLPTVVFGAGTGKVANAKIDNPIASTTIEALIASILKIIIAVGTPIAILFLIFSGFKFVMARGKPDGIKDAREMFIWTLVGIAILLGASLLAKIIEGTINQLGTGI